MNASKTAEELETMRQACRIAATVLAEVSAFIQPGVTTLAIDEYAAERMRHYGSKSAFLGYRKFPAQTCISINEQVVHGIAGQRVVKFGDIVSVDVGAVYEGFIGDNARTVAAGGCDVSVQRLMDVTEQALHEGISQARAGNRVRDISAAVQKCVESNGFSVVREFVGHGVGRSMHEEPQIPNFVERKPSPKLRAGMTLAIEPMVNSGGPAVKVLNDGWTVVTQDGKPSAHFEHTVLVTEDAPEILTCPDPIPFALNAPS